MSQLYVLAKDINPNHTRKAIRLRLVRKYDVPEGRYTNNIKSTECLFHDIEGTFVHVTIPKEYVQKFSTVFKESKLYAIKIFLVISNFYQYKTTQHRYMIKFNILTSVETHKNKEFGKFMFRVKPIEELISDGVNDKELIDVIGRVSEIYSPKEKVISGTTSRLVDFMIEDAKDNRIMCTVWDDHVSVIEPFFNAPMDGPMIILLQLCRAKYVDNKVRISSSYNATKVWINYDCEEVLQFKASLKESVTPLKSISSISILSHGNSLDNTGKSKMVISTISDLYDRFEEGIFCVPARIVGLEVGHRWYYESCKTKGCSKKLEHVEALMYCESCKISWKEGTLKYRVVVRVMDKTSDAPFILWDNECRELIGMPAVSLKNKYPKDDADWIPELDSLRSKAMVFKISVKTDHLKNPGKAIPVLKVINDDQLVSNFCPSWPDDQDQFSKMIDEEDKHDDSEPDAESGDEINSPALQQTVKANMEERVEPVEPGSTKRCLLDQFSSSKDVKKPKAVLIKQEKN